MAEPGANKLTESVQLDNDIQHLVFQELVFIAPTPGNRRVAPQESRYTSRRHAGQPPGLYGTTSSIITLADISSAWRKSYSACRLIEEIRGLIEETRQHPSNGSKRAIGH